MGRCYFYKFKKYCSDHKIKGYFYKGAEPKKIYGKLNDVQELPFAFNERLGITYTANSVLESDFATIETNKFGWYNDFLPKLEQIYMEEPDKIYLSGAWHSDGDNRNLYQLDCAAEGFDLMTRMFSTHPILLKSAIGLCQHSLTTQHYVDFCKTWHQKNEEWRQLPSSKRSLESGCTIDFEEQPEGLDVAWGKRAEGRPTILLSEPAIEVIVHKLVSQHETGQIQFHIDDFNACYADDADSPKDIPNYGYVSVILPGPEMDRDQVCTQISDEDDQFKNRLWEQPGRGIWVPANVVHCGRTPAEGCSREVYLIEVFSNGNLSSHNGENGHACKNVKSFRMTLSYLQAIQQRTAEGAEGAAGAAAAAVVTKANIYYVD